VTAEAGGELPGGLLVAAGQEEVLTIPPAAKFAASVLPMVPVPMMATVLSEIVTLVHLS
jgi:hypothetical protein